MAFPDRRIITLALGVTAAAIGCGPAVDITTSQEMKPGDNKRVAAGCIVTGDVYISGYFRTWPSFDHDPITGDITILDVTSGVSAPWGAYVDCDEQKPGAERVKDKMIRMLEPDNCETGCERIRVRVWNGVFATPLEIKTRQQILARG